MSIQKTIVPIVFVIAIAIIATAWLYNSPPKETPNEAKEPKGSDTHAPPTTQKQEAGYAAIDIKLGDIQFTEGDLRFTLNKITRYTAPDDSSTNQYHTIATIPLTDGYSFYVRDNDDAVILSVLVENMGTREIAAHNLKGKQNVRLLLNEKYVAPWFGPIGNLLQTDSRDSFYAFDHIDKTTQKIQLIYGGRVEQPSGILEIDFTAKAYRQIQ